jgi:hypothetical protein
MIAINRLLAPIYTIVFLGLSACASVNPIALAKLSAFDPLSADPQKIAVAARLPNTLKLRTGDLVMRILTDQTTGPNSINEAFYLAVSDVATRNAVLIIPEANERLQTAKIASQDFERLRSTLAKARALKAASNGKGVGSIQFLAENGCKTGKIGDAPLLLNIYVQTEPNGEWVHFIRSLDLRQALGEDRLAKIPDC